MSTIKKYKPSIGFIIVIAVLAIGVSVYLMQRANLFTRISLYRKYGVDVMQQEYVDIDEILAEDQVDGCNRNVHYLNAVSLMDLQTMVTNQYPELLLKTNNHCNAFSQPNYVYAAEDYSRVVSVNTDNAKVTAISISSTVNTFDQIDRAFWNTIVGSVEPTLVQEQWLDTSFEQFRVKYEQNVTWDEVATQRNGQEYTLYYSDTRNSGIYLRLIIQ